MRALLDTNVGLDSLLTRAPWHVSADEILRRSKPRVIDLAVSGRLGADRRELVLNRSQARGNGSGATRCTHVFDRLSNPTHRRADAGWCRCPARQRFRGQHSNGSRGGGRAGLCHVCHGAGPGDCVVGGPRPAPSHRLAAGHSTCQRCCSDARRANWFAATVSRRRGGIISRARSDEVADCMIPANRFYLTRLVLPHERTE